MGVAPHIAPAMPLLRLLAVNCAAGIAIALLALGGLLVVDVPLRELILRDQSPFVALALLGGGFIITFGSAVMGTAVMRLGGEPGSPPVSGGGRRSREDDASSADAVPVYVPARHHD